MQKKGFFYIPTWMITLLFIVSMGSLGFETLFILNMDTFETTTVNGRQYIKGTEQYQSGMEILKNSIIVSAGITLVLSGIIGYLALKRIKNENK